MTQPREANTDTREDEDGRIGAIVEAERRSGSNTVSRPETAIFQESRHIMHDPVDEAALSTAQQNERDR